MPGMVKKQKAPYLRLVVVDESQPRKLTICFTASQKRTDRVLHYLADLLSDEVGPHIITEEANGLSEGDTDPVS